MTEKILARASEKSQLRPGENVWVDVDILMTHDVCGPSSFDVFKKEFGQNAKVMSLLGIVRCIRHCFDWLIIIIFHSLLIITNF